MPSIASAALITFGHTGRGWERETAVAPTDVGSPKLRPSDYRIGAAGRMGDSIQRGRLPIPKRRFWSFGSAEAVLSYPRLAISAKSCSCTSRRASRWRLSRIRSVLVVEINYLVQRAIPASP
jgi:hypothetical protein